MIEATDVTTTVLFLCSVLLVVTSWKVWQLVGIIKRQRNVIDGLMTRLGCTMDE